MKKTLLIEVPNAGELTIEYLIEEKQEGGRHFKLITGWHDGMSFYFEYEPNKVGVVSIPQPFTEEFKRRTIYFPSAILNEEDLGGDGELECQS